MNQDACARVAFQPSSAGLIFANFHEYVHNTSVNQDVCARVAIQPSPADLIFTSICTRIGKIRPVLQVRKNP